MEASLPIEDQGRRTITEGPLGAAVFRFGLPLSVAMGLQACFNLVDLFVIGKLPNGALAIGALAICDIIAVLGTILCQGVSNASVGVVSRYFGRDDRARLNHATWNSLYIILAMSLVFGLVGTFGAELLIGDMVGASGEVRGIGVSYLQILVGNSWTIFFLLHLTALMRSVGNAFWPAVILIGANVLNAFLDVIMVYGPGPAPSYFGWGAEIASFFGIPRMGVDGAAWATVISRGVGVLVGAVVLLRLPVGPRLNLAEMRAKASELWRLVRLGIPSSAQFLVRVAAVLVCLSLIARVFTEPGDEAVLAAFGICIRLDMLALFQGLGWASAAATFVGANLGAGRPERASRAGWMASAFNAGAMVVLVVVYLVFSRSIVGWFNDEPAVLRVTQEYLWAVGWTYAFIGVAVVLSHALQGATDNVTSFLIDAVVILGFQIPALLLLVGAFDLPRSSIWYCIAGANVLSALAYAGWFVRGRWKSRAV